MCQLADWEEFMDMMRGRSMSMDTTTPRSKASSSVFVSFFGKEGWWEWLGNQGMYVALGHWF